MTKSDRVLLCRVGSRMCALAIAHVEETMRPMPVEALPEMPPFVLGVAIVRGSPIPVVDTARLLAEPAPLRATRFVTIKVGARRAALAVDAVVGVRDLVEGAHDLPPLFQDAGADVVRAIGALDMDLLLVLRSARIVPEHVWAALDVRLAGP